jgi:hypothetical protein
MMPYDGSPGGNALGMQFDEERRRQFDAANNALREQQPVASTPLNWLVFTLGLAIFLFVMAYGTAG